MKINNKKLISGVFLLLAVILSVIMISAVVTDNLEEEIEYKDCYDRYSNKIIGETCERETRTYYSIKEGFFIVGIGFSAMLWIMFYIMGDIEDMYDDWD